MRTRTNGLALLLTVGMALAPAVVWGQDYAPPDPVIPLPLFSNRPGRGGFYTFGEFLFMRETNPLHHQIIAIRGLQDTDGTITADITGTRIQPTDGSPPFILPGTRQPGTFLGSGTPALFADDAGGPGTYQAGWSIGLGWKFSNGTAVETSWTTLGEAKYSATATLAGPNPLRRLNDLTNRDFFLFDTFLFSPVFNFPNDFAGNRNKLRFGADFAAFGIWNGASVETIEFVQRFDQWDITGRIPVYEDDCSRCYGLIGSRLVWLWERFRWRVVSEDFAGSAAQDDVALYNNILSQRMYGPHIGTGYERRLGDTPLGTFSVSLDLRAALLLDIAKEEAKYERADFAISAKRSRKEYTVVPELQAQANIWWYPIEGVQIRVGYDAMGFFNTFASPSPVSFNYGGLDPPWEKGHFRLIEGFNAGVAFIF